MKAIGKVFNAALHQTCNLFAICGQEYQILYRGRLRWVRAEDWPRVS